MTDDPVPSEAPLDLDVLMSLDPCELSTQRGTEGRRRLDQIIAYQRRMREQREAGVRTKKIKDAPAAKIDITALLNAPAEGFKRRF